MDRGTGLTLTDLAHLRQSVGDILTTPIGSRTMRRAYGSLLPALVDQPDNATTQARVINAAATALMRWEPRLKLAEIKFTRALERPGAVQITLSGSYLSRTAAPLQPLTLDLPLSLRGAA